MPTVPSDLQLCVADESTFWPWVNWPDISNWPNKPGTLVIVPIAGTADWGLGAPLDAEETVLMTILKEVSSKRPKDLPLLVLPPIRWTLGPFPGCAFAIDPDVACNLLEEVVASVRFAGFTRIVFAVASPWMEELSKAVARDVRIALRAQVFCVYLSGLGLDFNPARGGDRQALKDLVAALMLDGDAAKGAQVLAAAAELLTGLLKEMRDRPPLARGGEIPMEAWP